MAAEAAAQPAMTAVAAVAPIQGIGTAFPCAEVNIANGLDRVLQTPSSATHVIVVPTTRISGIESPALLRENAPNYWEAAWDARRFVEEGARQDRNGN